MSISVSALSAVGFRRALTVVVVGAIAVSAVVIAPLTNADRANARSPQSVRTEIVAFATGTGPSNSVSAGAPWAAYPWVRSVPSAEPSPAATWPLIAPPDESTATAGSFATQGFLSEWARRVDAAARAAAKLKVEHEATIAAEAAAAVAAAVTAQVAAAAQAAAVAAARAAANVAALAAQGFAQRVWTSGFQNEINQCRGAVDVTAVYKVRTIAEHSNCGGSRFPIAAGSIVTITGVDSGRYRVIGVVAHLNGEVNHAEDIPRGYDLLFQTCVGGFTDMRFTALQRIG